MSQSSGSVLNCIIIDDEPLAREVIRGYIERIPSLRLLAECANPLQALTLLKQQEIHVIFLDIQMPEILGTEFVRVLKYRPEIIITTAYPQYAVEGFELDVADYLLKPVQFERFLKAVHKVLPLAAPAISIPLETAAPGKDTYLYFRTERKVMKVMVKEILYIEGMKNYIRVVTDTGVVITKNSMAAAAAMLPQDEFLRIHRSFIVIKSKIKSFNGDFVGVGKVEIPIGKIYKSEVMKALGE